MDTVKLHIERMGQNGDGVAQMADGRIAFVAGALPGETVQAKITEVRKNFVRALSIVREQDSEERIVPVCPIFDACGGCSLQHWHYDREAAYKENRVRQALLRIAGMTEPPVQPIVRASSDYGYRNKGQFPWGGRPGELVLGLYRRGSHEIIEARHCAIQDPRINEVLALAPDLANRYGLTPYDEIRQSGVLRHLLIRSARYSGNTLALIVVNELADGLKPFAEALLHEVPHLVGVGVNINPEKTNRILGPRSWALAGQSHIVEDILGMKFDLSFGSFFQVNPTQAARLYQLVLDSIGPHPREVWDIYAGVGTLAALAAQEAEVVRAIEINPDAIRDAQENFRLNGLQNVRIEEGAAEDRITRWVQQADVPPEAVIVDPPRSGLKSEVSEALLRLKSPRLVYVSCNPDTLARDVRVLSKEYQLVQVTPVDMFPRTDNVECCSLLVRKE